MPITPEDRDFLKSVFRKLKPEESLQPGDLRYQRVYDRPGCDDPTSKIRNQIDRSDGESTIFFSGFRGSGKTTELYRLRDELEKLGYVVIYADAMDYLNPSQPIEISNLLIILAGAFGDVLASAGIKSPGDTYWTRLVHWMTKTQVELKEIGIKTEAGFEPAKIGLDLKLELKSTPTFQQRVTKALQDRVGDLHRDVQDFFETAYKAIRAQRPEAAGVVFLFDSLEQIRGSLSEERKVFSSVEFLFSNYLQFLSIPYLHVVYTVPPWLKFVLKGVDMTVIPCIRTWENDGGRTRCEAGIEAMRELVARRFPQDGAERLLGPEWRVQLDRLIELSGGHFRDMLRLLREIVLRADGLPVDANLIDRSIIEVRSHFLPIAVEDARWLHKIAMERATPLRTDSPEEVARLTKFLDTHVVLYLRNGEEWYDVHPLLRDEVERIVAANPAANPA
jgi:hypothetical protein